ncbi:MAG: HIT domain-containing protein [Candidatus Omnitrophota bacterium]
MDRLWAPWRINYITGKKRKGCIFCRAKVSCQKDYVIFKTEHSIVMLNIFPYNNGHCLISPLRHIRDISQLKEIEALDLFRALEKTKRLLEKTLKPQGFNIGINLSRSAGAGITGHLHMHIVPRWIGDSNFMPAVHNTKVVSQSLDELKKLLKNAQAKKNY